VSAASSRRFRHAAHVSWRLVDDEAVLLNVDTSEYYSLDPVGALLWERLGKGEALEAAARAVAAEYGVPAARVQADARELIADLVAEGLLQPAAR
jgi:hypothetical protein